MSKLEKSIEAVAEEIRNGDYSGFERLVNYCAYMPKEVFEGALKLGYEKEDVYQEAMIALLHALHNFDKERNISFRTYASVCIRNHITSLLRQSQKAKNIPMADYISIEDIDLASTSEPENDWIQKEAFFDIKKQIFEALSDFEFEVLRLYLKGFSYKAIGEKLFKTEKSVSNALSRVRKKLRAIEPEK